MKCNASSYWVHTPVTDCDDDWWCSSVTWIEGGYCRPYCPPPEEFDPVTGTCRCADGFAPNSVGYCCPDPFVVVKDDTNPSTRHGYCDCPHDNEERLCLSRLPDDEQAECVDSCYCVEPFKSYLSDKTN
jgi:hypothetical protein